MCIQPGASTRTGMEAVPRRRNGGSWSAGERPQLLAGCRTLPRT